jgi:RNA polymerase sigma factor (sigma-70 family)
MINLEEIIKKKQIKQSEFEDFMEKCELSEKEYCEIIDKIVESNVEIISDDDNFEDEEENIFSFSENYYTQDILNQYFHDISNYQLLTKEEEREYLKKAKEGDEEAKEKIITSNLRLVAKIALHYSRAGVYYLDLIQEGTIGLINAIDKFDLSKNYKFSTYATWWIKKEIIDALKKRVNMIKIPNYIFLLHKKIDIFENDYLNKNNKKPEIKEIAKALNMSEEDILKVKNAIDMNMVDMKVETSKESDDHYDIKDYSTVEEIDKDIEKLLKQKKISTLLKKLNSREKKIIEMYYGLSVEGKFTFKEIGSELNISAERVRVLKERALNKLKYVGERLWEE